MRRGELPNDEDRSDELPSDSAGQSGDDQRLSQNANADEESVKELAETDQTYEAEVVEGVEDAGDHPEKPARTHERSTLTARSMIWRRGRITPLRTGFPATAFCPMPTACRTE
jgi:hypothetical protein